MVSHTWDAKTVHKNCTDISIWLLHRVHGVGK